MQQLNENLTRHELTVMFAIIVALAFVAILVVGYPVPDDPRSVAHRAIELCFVLMSTALALLFAYKTRSR